MSSRGLAPLLELRDRLQQISTVNGYNTDAGSSVFLGAAFITGDDAPAITVTQSDDQDAQPTIRSSMVTIQTPYIVEGIIAADRTQPFEQAFLLRDDMVRAVFQGRTADDDRLNGTATLMTWDGSRAEEAADGSDYAVARLQLTITHTEGLGRPSEAQ